MKPSAALRYLFLFYTCLNSIRFWTAHHLNYKSRYFKPEVISLWLKINREGARHYFAHFAAQLRDMIAAGQKAHADAAFTLLGHLARH